MEGVANKESAVSREKNLLKISLEKGGKIVETLENVLSPILGDLGVWGKEEQKQEKLSPLATDLRNMNKKADEIRHRLARILDNVEL